ncbi:hypothetical protein ACPA54_25515 [Uniformispora flossi]|uniref:hypothetical protein n=1 Tax=Uniformispora flossi TaxID=3390723 RepID=UPI003C2EDCFB
MTRLRQRTGRGTSAPRRRGPVTRAVITVLAACLLGFAAQVGSATVAAADDQDHMKGPERKACLYIPEDIWGFLFTFYCVDKEEKGVTKNYHGSSTVMGHRGEYKNGGLPCDHLYDNTVMAFFSQATHDMIGPLAGESGSLTECIKKHMLEFLQKHEASNGLGQSITADVKENPCNGIYDSDQRSDRHLNVCRTSVNQNPCLLIGTGQFQNGSNPTLVADMRTGCLKDHPDFKQQTAAESADDGGCEFLSGATKKDCETLATENAKAAPTSEQVSAQLNDFLGWALLAASCAVWIGVVGVGVGMARSWYTGEPGLLQFNRLGWVVFAAVLAGSATSIAGWFVL